MNFQIDWQQVAQGVLSAVLAGLIVTYLNQTLKLK